jgi:hypothetical protein
MKRSDLKLGMDVLVSSDSQWRSNSWASRVRVVNLDDWHRDRYNYGRQPETIELNDGAHEVPNIYRVIRGSTRKVNCFVGRIVREDLSLAPPRAYLLLHARAPWGEAMAARTAEAKARQAYLDKQTAERAAINARDQELVRRMTALGLTDVHLKTLGSRVTINLDHLTQLLDLADQLFASVRGGEDLRS